MQVQETIGMTLFGSHGEKGLQVMAMGPVPINLHLKLNSFRIHKLSWSQKTIETFTVQYRAQNHFVGIKEKINSTLSAQRLFLS